MDLRKLKDKATEAFAKGKFAKAAELYEAYCLADPKDLQARLRMGDAWAKAGGKGTREKAIDAYRSAAEGFAKEGFLPRAIAASKLILELDPAHQGIQQMLASLYARKSDPADGARRRTTTGTMPAIQVPAKPVVDKHAPIELPDEPEPPKGIELPAEPAAVPPPEPEEEVQARAGPPAARADEPIELTPSPPAPKKAPPAPPHAGPKVIELSDEDDGSGVELDLDAEARKVAAELSAAEQPVPLARDKELPPSLNPNPDPPTLATTLELELEPESPAGAAPAVEAPPEFSLEFEGEGAAPPAVELVTEPADTAVEPVLELTVKKPSEPPAPAPVAAAAAPSPAAPPRVSRIWLPGAFEAEPQLPPKPAEVAARPTYETTPHAKVQGRREIERTLAAFSKFDELDEALAPLTEVAQDTAPPAIAPMPNQVRPPAALEPTAPAAPPEPATEASPEPAFAQTPRIPTFTELELDGDSLLHAVEMAAVAGQSLRGEDQPAAALEEPGPAPEEAAAEEAAPLAGGLPKIPLFSDLPPDAFIELFERCPLRRYTTGDRIIDQGSVGDAFYVICAGAVKVVREDGDERRELATLQEGAFFGEVALISGAPRTASVDASAEETQLLEISAPVLAQLSHRYPSVATALKKFCRQRLLSNVMNTSALFRPFDKKQRKAVIERFRARDVNRGDVVIKEGAQTDGLYVVLSGEVEVRKGGTVLAHLKEGEVFGEMSLLHRTPATATVAAAKRTSLLRLPRKDFDQVISLHPQLLATMSELSGERQRHNEQVLATQTGEHTLLV